MSTHPDHGDGADLWAAKVNLQRAERAEQAARDIYLLMVRLSRTTSASACCHLMASAKRIAASIGIEPSILRE